PGHRDRPRGDLRLGHRGAALADRGAGEHRPADQRSPRNRRRPLHRRGEGRAAGGPVPGAARDRGPAGLDAAALRHRDRPARRCPLRHPAETYAWGIEELRSLIAEQESIAQQINDHHGTGGGRSIAAAKDALRADPSRVLHGTEALQAWMQQLSDTAIDQLADVHFDIPPPLRRLECRIATTGSGGIYYTGPSDDLNRPGRMWWDVPPGTEEFHTWLETTTVYHEGVPGH